MPCSQESLIQGPSCPVQVPTLYIPHGGTKDIDLVVQDRDGVVIDLTFAGSNPALRIVFTAVESWASSTSVFKIEGIVTDGQNGAVTFPLTAIHTGSPGIYTATLDVFVAGALLHRQKYFIEITPSDLYQSFGPLTIAELRLHLRDGCAEANTLLDDFEWSDTEIAAAIRHPLDWFNAQPPPVGTLFTPITFPFRYPWLQFTVGLLLRSAAYSYRRNRLKYSAGGVTVDPDNRAEEYEKIAELRIKEAKEQLSDAKITINIENGYATVTSPYRFTRVS